MRSIRAHNQLAARRFIQQFKAAFTTRSDGSTWPKFDRTWRHADQERLERFVRESPWEHEQVEEHLRTTAPEKVQGPDAALIVDGMGIPKKGDHSVGVYQQWCGAARLHAEKPPSVILNIDPPIRWSKSTRSRPIRVRLASKTTNQAVKQAETAERLALRNARNTSIAIDVQNRSMVHINSSGNSISD